MEEKREEKRRRRDEEMPVSQEEEARFLSEVDVLETLSREELDAESAARGSM